MTALFAKNKTHKKLSTCSHYATHSFTVSRLSRFLSMQPLFKRSTRVLMVFPAGGGTVYDGFEHLNRPIGG